MKKNILTVVTLAFVLTLVCALFAACTKEEPAKYNITYKYDKEIVTLVAEGYDELPTELVDGTEVTFKLTVKDGYSATVSGVGVKKESDTVYKLTVSKAVTITISTTKILNDITVTVPLDRYFFDGQKIDPSLITVVANYKLGDETVTEYTIEYGENKAEIFNTDDTVFYVTFGGITKEFTLENPVQDQQSFLSVTVKADTDKNPVLVITGIYNAGTDKAAAEAAIEGFLESFKENSTWSKKAFEAKANVNDDNTFVMEVTLKEWSTGKQYYLQTKLGKDGSDLSCPGGVDEETIVKLEDGTTFHLTDGYSDWGSHPVFLWIETTAAVNVNKVSYVVDGGKAYALFSGTYGTNTREQLATYIIDGEVSGRTKLELEIVEYNADGTFVMKADLSNLATGTYYLHAGFEEEPGNLPAATAIVDEDNSTVTVNGLTYTFGEAWGCRQIIIANAEAAE